MRKANELFGKTIVAQSGGDRLATVRDVILDADARNVAALLVDSGGWFGKAKVVLWKDLISAGDVVIIPSADSITTVEQSSEVAALLDRPTRLTGTTLISENGERIGTVGDLFINDSGEVVGYEVKGGFISNLGGRKFLPVDDIQAIGKDAIIASDGAITSVKQAALDESAAARALGNEESMPADLDSPEVPISEIGSVAAPTSMAGSIDAPIRPAEPADDTVPPRDPTL